jgi:hypothetical protein
VASVQKKGETFYCQFVHGGKRHTVTVGKVSRSGADAFATRTEELLGLLARGRLTLPPGIAITRFVLRDGRVEEAQPDAPAKVLEPLKLSDFKATYLEARSGGSMEANSLATARMHMGHFERTLGKGFDLRRLTLADLQPHVNRRRKEGDPRRKVPREKPISAATLRLEVSTLRSAWNWAALNGLVSGHFPAKACSTPRPTSSLPS